MAAAFLLWLLVMNIEDPEDQKTFYTIPVKLINTETIEQEGMVYEVLDKSDTVRTVLVTAPKSVRDELSSSDIIAEADFNNLTKNDTVEIQFYSLRYNDRISEIKGSNEILKLSIEDKKTKRLALSAETTGTVKEGYMIHDVSLDQNQIEVSGPQSLISKITTAKLLVDVTDSASNILTYSDVILYDAEGNIIYGDNITKNTDSVRVKVEVLATKVVPIMYSVMGVPADGYLFTGEIESNPDTVMLAGPTDILNTVNHMIVGEEALNITGQAEDMITNVNLNDYLPAGTILANTGFKGKTTVTVHIEKLQSRELHVPSSNIKITNIPEGYSANLEGENISHSVIIQGLKVDVESLDQNVLVGYVDISEFMKANNMETLETGIYNVEVNMNLASRIEIPHPLTVQIKITKTEEN